MVTQYSLVSAYWDSHRPGRGDYSGLTGDGALYRTKYGEEAEDVGTSTFASAAMLSHAIELTNSLDPQAVAATLRSTMLKEFYSDISFDTGGQNMMPILALQNSPSNGSTPLVLADGVVVVPVAFPAPTIEQRKCRTQSAGAAGEECFGNGLCDELGACICSGSFNRKPSASTHCHRTHSG